MKSSVDQNQSLSISVDLHCQNVYIHMLSVPERVIQSDVIDGVMIWH